MEKFRQCFFHCYFSLIHWSSPLEIKLGCIWFMKESRLNLDLDDCELLESILQKRRKHRRFSPNVQKNLSYISHPIHNLAFCVDIPYILFGSNPWRRFHTKTFRVTFTMICQPISCPDCETESRQWTLQCTKHTHTLPFPPPTQHRRSWPWAWPLCAHTLRLPERTASASFALWLTGNSWDHVICILKHTRTECHCDSS